MDMELIVELDSRDQFAMAALTGVMASPGDNVSIGGGQVSPSPRDIAAEAYRIADAMLEARRPKESPKKG